MCSSIKLILSMMLPKIYIHFFNKSTNLRSINIDLIRRDKEEFRGSPATTLTRSPLVVSFLSPRHCLRTELTTTGLPVQEEKEKPTGAGRSVDTQVTAICAFHE